ncbi:YicC/YloC family endoribonuclease [Tepidicaulis sp. LMO-SS28]|uniref:YicC/YloC family endoribonuclease n=1 Tax=Tepidicaulis sp. LMO-SS28 TaxID=3447455 RepID=UPI003EDFFCFC
MTISSMTGFARAEGACEGARWHWELRSVNGKGLDLRLRTPPGFDALEPKLKAIAAEKLKRGNVQANLQLTRETSANVPRLNEDALKAVLEATARLRDHQIYLADSSAEGILSLKGVMETGEAEESEEARARLEAALVESFAEAMKKLGAARREEGEKLFAFLSGQVTRIEELTRDAAASPAAGQDAMRERLKRQVEELLGASPALNEERLAQEAALLATKADVREELDRLAAHVEQARELLAAKEPVGRRLDFLTQEFNREANTLCSKAADVALTRIGLELKTVIDQLREQVQNVE